jgi:hypothetical protein
MVRRKQILDTSRLSPLTGERGSGRLCGLRNRGQHVDKLAQRTAGTASLMRGGWEPGSRVPKTERAEDAGVGLRAASQDRFGSSNSNKSAREARGHHTQHQS